EDIVETWARYHCARVCRMIIVCHRCTDHTESILQSLHSEGLPIDIRTDQHLAHLQSEVLTALLHECVYTHAPDWILPLDGDEFLSCEGGLQTTLHTEPSDRILLLPWHTYVPTPSDSGNEPDIRKRITHQQAEEYQWYKVCIPRSCILPGMRLTLGSHSAMDAHGQELPSHHSTTLFLDHYPVRSEAQLRKKIIHGWESHLANPNRQPGEIFQWEMLYERCKDPAPISAEELERIARTYAVPLQ
ncbi:hypothetical protein COW95_00725, partial [Candidatus Peregrinibacteria bacterium CG22_combo_CG10-13_8_21_14_all_49_11]